MTSLKRFLFSTAGVANSKADAFQLLLLLGLIGYAAANTNFLSEMLLIGRNPAQWLIWREHLQSNAFLTSFILPAWQSFRSCIDLSPWKFGSERFVSSQPDSKCHSTVGDAAQPVVLLDYRASGQEVLSPQRRDEHQFYLQPAQSRPLLLSRGQMPRREPITRAIPDIPCKPYWASTPSERCIHYTDATISSQFEESLSSLYCPPIN